MKLLMINLISILSTQSSSGSSTQCGTGEECIYKEWMPWQPCTGSCGQETQIRQRVFCCPGSLMNISVALRTLDLCTRTCKTPKYYLTEGKHCHQCSNNGVYNVTARTCACLKRYKGQCCQVACVFLCFGVVFTDSDVCNNRTYCTTMTWQSWGSCKGECGKQTFQLRKRFMCAEVTKIANPTRLKVLKYCNFSLSTSFEERRACKYCLYGLYNITTNSCEICKSVTCSDRPCKHGVCYDTSSGFRCDCDIGYSDIDCSTDLSEELELPSWLPKVEIALLSIITMILLMTTGCICLKCCKICGCISSDDDDDDEKKKKRKKNQWSKTRPTIDESFDF